MPDIMPSIISGILTQGNVGFAPPGACSPPFPGVRSGTASDDGYAAGPGLFSLLIRPERSILGMTVVTAKLPVCVAAGSPIAPVASIASQSSRR